MLQPLATLSRTLVLAVSVLAPSLAAQQVIGTAFGQTLEGTLISDDGKAITFRTSQGTEMKLPYAELDKATVYRLMDARTGKTDAAGQMAVGDQAAAADLFDAARDAYSLAVKADPSLTAAVDAKLNTLRVAASNSLLAEAKHASEHGRPDVALHDLALLMHEFPGEPAAQEASTMYETLHTSQAAARSKAQAQAQSQEVQQALAPLEASYAEMGKKIKQGLQNPSGNQTDAIDAFKSAIEVGKSARLNLKELQGQDSTIGGLAAASQQLDHDLVGQLLDAYTQLANAYNQRSAYNDANNAVNAGLALDPQNQQLLQMRSQIASNSASSGSGGFVGWRATNVRMTR